MLKKLQTLRVNAGSVHGVHTDFPAYVPRPKIGKKLRAFELDGDELLIDDAPDEDSIFVLVPMLTEKTTIVLYYDDGENHKKKGMWERFIHGNKD